MLAGLSLDYSGRMRLCGCLGKARRGQPSPTAVGRYVDSYAARPTKALAAILTKYAKRIAAKSAKRLGKVFDPDQPRDERGRWGEGDGAATREPVTQTSEFKAWFGDSKVVDAAGKPLVVYHGTNEDFTTFRPSARSKEPGIFFAPDPAIASLYTGFDPGGNFHAEEVGSVLPVYLRIENPLVVDFDGSETGRTEAFKRAIEGGHDGVLLRNHYDAGGVQDQWAVFKPEQIKSAIGNSGRFDPKSPDITKAFTKAEDDDLKALLAALEDEMKDMSAEMRLALATEMLAAFRRAGTVGVMQAGFAMTPEIVKQLDEKARAFAEERGGWLIKNLAGTTIENLRATLARGVEEGMSADDLSEAIQEAGAFGEFRADMIARTELAFAHVQGNVEGWRITGEVELKRSILGDLHDIDDECDEAVDAGDIPLEDEFIDGYAFPPYHPNSCLQGSSFASYGELLQMVSAPYKGPAIRLELEAKRADGAHEEPPRNAGLAPDASDRRPVSEHAEGGFDLPEVDRGGHALPVGAHRVILTIGPNHPMLTQRGFVAAKAINEGDQLLHDAYAQDSLARAGETNLEKVMLFEDSFNSLSALCRTTFVADAADYFHGDEAFIYGEVKAIRPKSGLLPVVDPGGVEHLCKDALMWANANPASLTGCGAPDFRLWTVGLPAPGNSGGGRAAHPIFDGHGGISRFHCFRVVASHVVQFEGLAFDASTASGIYNNGGFVVKNCICDVLPILREGQDGEG